MKKKMPFGKNSHVDAILPIAKGLHLAGKLDYYLEIGIRRGPCFNVVAPLVKKTAYAVDIEVGCYKHIKHNKNLNFTCGRSEKFLENHDPKIKFDLVFIDGDHTFEAVRRDFDLVFDLVKDNGMILLHDVYPPAEEYLSKSYCNDCYKIGDYIKAEYLHPDYSPSAEFVTLPFYFGVGIVRKATRQLMWK